MITPVLFVRLARAHLALARFTPKRQQRLADALAVMAHAGVDGDDDTLDTTITSLSPTDRLHALLVIGGWVGQAHLQAAGGNKQLAHDRIAAGLLDTQLPPDLTACGCDEGDQDGGLA